MPYPREKHHVGETSKKTPDLSMSESKTETPEGPCTQGSPDGSSSPISDDTCPICLGSITDKCMANSCHHCFCLVCLKEWSKQKAVCPLCKESFTTIMYDIKSELEFKTWKVPRIEPSESLTNFQAFFVSGRRFFGYRTTNFPGAATLRRQHGGDAAPAADVIPSGPRERSSASYRLRGSSFFRLNIYLNNEWVQPIADVTGRYRQSSPELYREQPALTHRLVPWVNRELAALVPSARIGVVLTEVMDLIERYPINSREFRQAIRPHLGNRTNHFVHEFYHFARSPYDMVGHDNAARYLTRYDFNDAGSSESSSSEDSDAVVEVDVRGNPVSSTSNRGPQQGLSALNNVEREEVLTQEGSVLISSDESTNNEIPQQSNLFVQSSVLQPSLNETHNPEPYIPATITMTQLLGRARNFLNSVNEGASTSLAEGSATRSNANKILKREVPSDSDDSDACMIIEEVSRTQPTPEIITLESEEENKLRSSSSKERKHFEKKSVEISTQDGGEASNSHSPQKKKGKKKPCLNRTNFPISQSQTSADDSSKQLRRDHSYCSEQKAEILSFNTKGRPDKLSSSEVHQPKKSLQTYKEKHKCLILSSDSEVNFQMHKRKKLKYKEKKCKTRKIMASPKYEDLSKDICGSCSWHGSSSPAKKPRKDNKSKIKNSSQSLNQIPSHIQHNCVCITGVTVGTSSSSLTESSSRDGHWQDGSSSEYSSNPRNFHYKERKDRHSSSKAKYLNRRGKHKKKDKYKEKNKKEKKRRHKKKYKTRKSGSSSSSDSESS